MSPAKRVQVASAAGLGLGGIAYFLALFNYAFDPLRGATGVRYAEQFFDLQADAIRSGHLWVPENSLGIEGFVVDDRTYSYFGIFPALLRIPVQLVTHEYDGRLTLLSMAVGWVVFATMATRLFWLIRGLMGRPPTPSRSEATLAAFFLAAATGGTVLTFDAALPWVYHEVYVWSVATVVGALYWLLRVLNAPDQRAIGWLCAFALMAALTRTPGGWAVCLATIAGGAWLASGRLRPRDSRLWLGVLAAGALPLLAGIVINYLKFRHPYMFPLQNQVWTELNAHRRAVLEQNGGSLAGLQFFPSSLVNYFRPDGIRFVDYFPWITLPPEAAEGYGAVLDQSSRTGSVPSFMPLLFVLSLASIPVLFRRRVSKQVRTIRLIWFGALLMTGGVMAYGYIAYRYTSEFVPGLVVGGAVSTVALGGWLSARVRVVPVVACVGVFAALTAFSLLAQMAVGYSVAASTYKGPPLESYLSKQLTLSGSTNAYQRLVTHSPGKPLGGRADDLWIRGDCDALYFNTGEASDPWSVVQERDTAVEVQIGPSAVPGRYLLLRDSEESENTVSLRVTTDRQAQLIVDSDEGEKRGQLFDLAPDVEIRVGARILTELGAAEISSTPGGFVGFLPTGRWDEDQKPVLSSIEAVPVTDAPPGISVQAAPTLPLPLCQRIARAAGVDTSAAD